MNEITEEKPIKYLAKPLRHSTNSMEKNMFASMQKTQPLPSLQKIRGKSYDIVGSKDFKDKMLEIQDKTSRNNNDQNDTLNMTGLPTNLNTTINRQTMMSKMAYEQKTALLKQPKHMDRYK